MSDLIGQLQTFLRKPPTLGQGVYLAQTAVVVGDVTLGDFSSVWYHAVLRGDIHRIVVGHHSNIQDNAVVHLADELPCLIGKTPASVYSTASMSGHPRAAEFDLRRAAEEIECDLVCVVTVALARFQLIGRTEEFNDGDQAPGVVTDLDPPFDFIVHEHVDR
jgi:hypothetical protein